jgi:nicotinamide mononucleotide (NMN) deamidase PncC
MTVMTKRRRLAAAALVIGLAGIAVPGLGTGPAQAADPSMTIVSAKHQAFASGDAVTIAGAGFAPNTRIELGQCLGSRGYPVGENLMTTDQVGAAKYYKNDLYCSPGAGTTKENLGATYVAWAGADGTFLAKLVLFRGNGSRASVRSASVPTEYLTVNTIFDDKNPGTIVARSALTSVRIPKTVYASMPVTFAADSNTLACGPPAATTAGGSGGAASTPVYLSLATAMCTSAGAATSLPVDFTETGEAAGLTAFQTGQADLAFAATGFNPPGGQKTVGTRKAIFVPIALQAATLAFAGNAQFLDAFSAPAYRLVNQVQATPAELADFFRGGSSTPKDSQIAAAFLARNPALPQDSPQPLVRYMMALATADSSTLATTTTFTASDRTPQHAIWPAGVVHSLPLPSAGVPISGQLSESANFTSLRNTSLGFLMDNGSPLLGITLTVTDTSSAAALGLTPVALQNAAGKFVAPTKDSVYAALPAMKRQPDGTLFPNPQATGNNAYPMPLVLYAVIPADTSSAHRDSVVKFLDYALGGGQSKLPAGTYPLTVDMLTAAKSALHPPAAPPKNNSNQPPNNSTSPNTTTPSASPSPGAGAALAGSRPVSAAGARNAANTVNNVGIPLFPGLSAVAGWLAPLGLVLLIALSSSVAYISSGRPLPGPVQAALTLVTRRLRAVREHLPHWLPGASIAT